MQRKTKKVTKKRTISACKKQAWMAFSEWIRLRDCISTTGNTDSGVCITCGKLVSGGNRQAGHFIAGRTNAILFDEDIVHLQCFGCNVCNHGEQLEYYYAMKKLGYTEDEITILRQRRNTACKYTAEDYETIAEYYKKKADLLRSAFLLGGAYSKKTISLSSLPHACSSPEASQPWVHKQ
jgi:hypothetical protein